MTQWVCGDPGHGGPDPGAVDTKDPTEGDVVYTEEDDVAFVICQQMLDSVERLQYAVTCTRRRDQFVPLSNRAGHANRVRADAFVSIHCNAGPPSAQGFEAYCYPGSQRGAQLRDSILAELAGEFPEWVNRGGKEANYAVLRRTAMPAVLVECGFVTNVEEEKRLQNPAIQRRMGAAIARGVDKWLRSSR